MKLPPRLLLLAIVFFGVTLDPTFAATGLPGKKATADLEIGTLTYTQTYTFTTWAGTFSQGNPGTANGTGAAAQFWEPAGVAVDPAGNVYVADYGSGLVRKITPGAVVTTLAKVPNAIGIGLDPAGDLYVSDLTDAVIYKVTSSGVATVFAGTPGVTGTADGTGAAAQFKFPYGVAVDATGNVYVVDSAGETIRKITPAGVVTTIAGTPGVSGYADDTGLSARFNAPACIAIAPSGNLFVSDTGNNCIREVTPSGVVTTFAGTARVVEGAVDGTGESAFFAGPYGLAFDPNGNLLVAESDSDLVRRITPAGVVTTCAGVPGDTGPSTGAGANAYFDGPIGLAIDGSGNIYVANSESNNIAKGVYTAPAAPITVVVPTPIPSNSVANGSAPITLTASTTGTPTSYQWSLNGQPISGATSYQWVVYPTAANQGSYTVAASNSTSGTVTAEAGTLTVTTDAWLVNLSARAYAETGANQLIAGFVTTGPSDKSVLIRGDGPSLAAFSITDFLSDPQLTLVSGSTTVATTNSWSTSLDSVFSQVGAFALTPGSHDTALLESLAPGPYTAQVVSQTTNSGVALAEIYDADNGAPSNRLINISARAFVGTGTNILIGGFVIGGSTPQTVIIRGDGPSLVGFGLSGALPGATLTLSNSAGATIATNSGWSTAPTLGSGATSGITVQPLTAALSAKVGAFALTAGSDDAAIVATLPPGSYTAQVAGANGATGVALVEVYEVR